MNKNPPSSSSHLSSISFKPVTEGLGFHPFSDGLPYAPMGKNPKPSGTSKPTTAARPVSSSGAGAIAAGPPRMVSSQTVSKVPMVSVPVVKKSGPAPAVQPPNLVFKKNQPRMVYVSTRSLAYLFDVSLNSLLMGGILIGLVWNGKLQIDLLLGYGVPAGTAVFFSISSWGMIALQEVLFRSSLGKYLFNLRLDGGRFKILLRALWFPISIGFLGVGVFWGIFHGRSSCWHDILSGIQPIDSDKKQ